ncbi:MULTISPECIES: ABC transporter substrate-binding protein [Nonomuraea]|uniref:ABC transporter substrate-binding protein n=1 Tax=Nonomuraea ferruginea TaxID=46174 RepID=A0ABT4ST39_9ACTN|nr:ABC transporter substrate-binding protein [Nonomuraea ferruginea]MDA0640426.1 ABC transporter substrate-binding protein [Nonomuraea ferruginea]
MRIKSCIAIGTLLTLSLTACGGSAPGGAAPASPDASGTIKIGSIHPLTGALAFDGQQMSKAIKLAAKAINDSGGIKSLGGAKLEILDADSQGKPEIGQSEAQRLTQAGAVALVGPYQSAVAAQVATVAERNKVPFVIDVASADDILKQGYTYTFRLQPSSDTLGRYGARYLKDLADRTGQQITKVAYLHEQTDYGSSTYESFTDEAAKLGLQVGPRITYDALKAADLTTELTKVKAAGVDALAVTGYYRDGLLTAKAIASVQPGVKIVLGVSHGAFSSPVFPRDGGAAAEGVYDSNFNYDATKPESKAILDAFQAEYGEELRFIPFTSYECVRLVAAALEKAASRDPAKIREALAGISFDTLMAFDGPVQFDESGQNENATPIVLQVQDGKVVPVHPAAKAVAEPRPAAE